MTPNFFHNNKQDRFIARHRKRMVVQATRLVPQYMDSLTGEVLLTPLAESLANHYNVYYADMSIPEEIFEIAFEGAERYEASS